jgi:antitoxin component YwqK of YwqJK toxin-antitoxin module
MPLKQLRAIIPPDSRARVIARSSTGQKTQAFYYRNGQKVGSRWWDDDGTLSMEYGMKGNLMHGPFRTFDSEGRLSHQSSYQFGKEHGLARQYANGKLIGSYRMKHGTGADLWYAYEGCVAEERYYQDGKLHGYERWWDVDNKTIHQESHFCMNLQHGILREWNSQGKLCRGFPQYFIQGRKVTRGARHRSWG